MINDQEMKEYAKAYVKGLEDSELVPVLRATIYRIENCVMGEAKKREEKYFAYLVRREMVKRNMPLYNGKGI